MDWMVVGEAIWLILPAYLANSAAVVLGGGRPIDSGRTWRGSRLLGDGKTWRGLLSGVAIGIIAGFAMNSVAPYTFGDGVTAAAIIVSLPLGALIGDLVESFLKRRIGKESGESWPVADQMDFLFGALLLSYLVSVVFEQSSKGNWFLEHFTGWHIVFLLVFTPLVHYLANVIGYILGLKKVPW
jgi:CDP-2,3-bis-(O-geranylgeranyl)-sn-glycerol synthase